MALAAVLRVAWTYLVSLSADEGDWFNYIPSSAGDSVFGPGLDLGRTLLAIAFIIIWACASLWLLGRPYPDSPDRRGSPESK